MKTRLFFVLILAISLFSTSVNANNGSFSYDLGGGTQVKISAIKNTKTVVVSLTNVTKEEVNIALESDAGILVEENVSSKPNFSRKYNLTNLEMGSYSLVITKKQSKTVQSFELTAASIVFLERKNQETFLPMINQNGTKLDINVLLGNYSNIKINIYDNEGLKVYDDINYVVMLLHKRYDLSKLPKGGYVVEVMVGDNTEYFPITL